MGWALCLLASLLASEARADDDLGTSPGRDSTADYVIRARLDPESHTVSGAQTVRLTNRSARAVDRLTFHLYLNGFENDRTLWMRESGGELRGARLGEFGYLDVTELSVGGAALLDKARLDETLLHVPLPRPVPPGGTVEVEMTFTALLPSAFARTGWARDFHMVAQWFPKLARLRSDGTFAARPYHATHEYDADFGSYEVTMDIPHGTVVGATGEPVATERRGDRDVIVHRASSVHDFAWAASPHFVEQVVRAGHVRIRSLSYPGQGPQVVRQLEAIRRAMSRFEELYGRYPYPGLTVVSPPEDALGAGGMEYPTLITTGSRFFWPSGVRLAEEVAIHELGHQWFYGLLASNEPDEAWLDEGLNTWATGRIMDELYGPRSSTVDLGSLQIGYGAISRIARSIAETREPIAQRSASFASMTSYGTHVYYGTDLLLRTLARHVGRQALDRALARYAHAYRFGHPTTDDLVAVLREDLGRGPIDELVEPVLRRAARFDVRVVSVQSEALREASGWVRRRGKRVYVAEGRPRAPARYLTSVLVARDGDVRLPITVEVVFASGRRQRIRWDGEGRWKRIELSDREPAIGAIADPDLDVPLDTNLLDRSRAAPGRGEGTSRLWWRLLYAAQTMLQVLGP